MKLTSLKAAGAAVAGIAAGAALLLSATPASAANPPYDGCPGWALCLYQDGGGAGSKAIITPPAAGGNTKIVRLTNTHFLNGQPADNQTSSWLNNSQCEIEFWDDPNGELHPSDLDFTPSWNWGAKGDYVGTSKYYDNDRLSSLRFYCP
ncbi:peptidase inhibitor family I36 protein [Streptomyces longispororuber]|uniref:peptidase inhibitor family I36 protein n=1 Tax=Streptomyces longispororuber TaxID=68230 RepID=UPI00210B942E|nr:peptidase inhibitor family I36 protein [Streptomyces longispororuber]MCQ4212815.1 peptidase inhibitor family I36 protein [Streptomyces longispororuber]